MTMKGGTAVAVPPPKGGATIFKVGVQPASEKIFFDPPTFGLPGGDIKQDITVFITAIMTYKRLCLPAPNDYMCDYCGYGETETVKECHFWVLVSGHSILLM